MLSRKADCHPERENQLTEVYRALRKKVKERGDRWFEPTAGSLEAMRDLKLVAATDAERLKKQDPENGAGSAALEKAWNLCDEKKEILKELLFRMNAVKTAEDKKYVLMNAPKERLEEIIQVLPGMKSRR